MSFFIKFTGKNITVNSAASANNNEGYPTIIKELNRVMKKVKRKAAILNKGI
jgi:hypothetical protein